MPWRPLSAGDFPTLGWFFLEWTSEELARPECQEYEPFIATQEQADFALEFYRLNPRTGQRMRRRGVISRPRGWGKSPFSAAFAAFEAIGPAVPDGWDAEGQPVGMPWSEIRKPLVEIAAVSEDQVDTNTWSPLIDMLSRGPAVDDYPGLEPMAGFVNLPYGRIQKRTAEASSAKGAPAHFVVCDQTEAWTRSNGGVKLFNTLRNNVIKRGGHLLESPNAFTPGENSVAESSMATYISMRSGKTKTDDGLIFDHREAPPETDMADAASLMRGLEVAYGDSADVKKCAIHEPPCKRPGWVDLGHIAASIWELDADPQLSRSDWLNQITHASDAWLSQPEWAACLNTGAVVADQDTIVLGFDGSRKRSRGITDATAIIGCRVEDGHLFEVGVWEQPTGAQGTDWEVPTSEVEAALRSAFNRWKVVGFYADPALWETYIAKWEAEYGRKLTVGRRDHPIEWWMNRPTITVRALEQFHSAVLDRELTHSGEGTLTRHVLNARRRTSTAGIQIAKAHPTSGDKIDAAIAATLAWQARLDALALAPAKVRTGQAFFR